MKKMLNPFAMPKEGKVSDKMMTFNIVACIVGMLLCVFSLTAATWAWFADSITSPVNQVQTGEYKVYVSITDSATGDEVLPDSVGVYTLAANGVYNVNLVAQGTVSTGYFAIGFESEPDQKFYTPQIFTEVSEKSPTSISFTLACTEDEELTVGAWWGTSTTPNEERELQEGQAYTFDSTTGKLTPNEAVALTPNE